MKCYECGKGRLKPGVVDVTTTFRGENILVKAQVETCNRCGFQIVRGEDVGKFSLLVADEYRRKHGLLTSGEIRERRERLHMSQEAFARYLGVGVASVKRWELGLIQDKAMNELMLLKTDPDVAEAHSRALRKRLFHAVEDEWRDIDAGAAPQSRQGSWAETGSLRPAHPASEDFAYGA